MLSLSSIFTASLLVALARTSPLQKRDTSSSVVLGLLGTDGYWNDYDGGTNMYVEYTGDGSRTDGWPGVESWVSFNEMWITNAHIIARSCDLWYKQPNNDMQETQDLYDAIKQVSHETRVDHRFIFAIVIQETKGCVRAATNTDNNADNTGLLQDYKGAYSCNNNGKVQTPCPKDQILGMIRDGVAGSSDGHGLAEDINAQKDHVDNEVAEAYYRAARLYNSGSIDASNDLEKSATEKCYASDVANRLMGWTDSQNTCTLDSKS